MRISLHKRNDLSEVEGQELKNLSQAVYSPEDVSNWPGRSLEWSRPEIAIFLRENDEQLACHAGLLIRSALYNGADVRIGGVGGVMTRPDARRQGYAAQALKSALDFFHENLADFGLLVCEHRLLDYYGQSGWKEFNGQLLVMQHAAPAEFTFNKVMVQDVKKTSPVTGVIDLLGPPW